MRQRFDYYFEKIFDKKTSVYLNTWDKDVVESSKGAPIFRQVALFLAKKPKQVQYKLGFCEIL
tara:strand:+ start:601 stop:789 length:189 start_codon:yes stop_codon:yes gene_type:complete